MWHITRKYKMTITEQKYELLNINSMLLLAFISPYAGNTKEFQKAHVSEIYFQNVN